jgi:hypothetical protein
MEREVGADIEDEEGKICRVPTVCVIGWMLIATYSKLNLIKGLIYKKLLIIYRQISKQWVPARALFPRSPGFLHPLPPV